MEVEKQEINERFSRQRETIKSNARELIET